MANPSNQFRGVPSWVTQGLTFQSADEAAFRFRVEKLGRRMRERLHRFHPSSRRLIAAKSSLTDLLDYVANVFEGRSWIRPIDRKSAVNKLKNARSWILMI